MFGKTIPLRTIEKHQRADLYDFLHVELIATHEPISSSLRKKTQQNAFTLCSLRSAQVFSMIRAGVYCRPTRAAGKGEHYSRILD